MQQLIDTTVDWLALFPGLCPADFSPSLQDKNLGGGLRKEAF